MSTFLSTPSCSACSHPERETIDRELVRGAGPVAPVRLRVLPTGYGEFAKYYRKVGKAYYDLGRYEEAIESFSATLRIKPDFPEALFSKGLALEKLGRYEEAMELGHDRE